MANKRLSILSTRLINDLQIAGVLTGNSITISDADARALFHMISTLAIYQATKGLPEDLVALLEQP
jgi:hypothetical protein